MTTNGIRPNFKLHELHAEPGRMNSPHEPCVDVYTRDLGDGRIYGSIDQLTPAQARAYARMILDAADAAEGRDRREDAVEAAARAYFGVENLAYPSDPERQARSQERWDAGGVEPHIMQVCRDAVSPLVLPVLAAAEDVTDRG